ncbi:hypothetical protein BGZ63DRAFT_382041 [Mariannaea sp. PMI_226]|nr:hypothetical protein BGZ63DRAFT_382041 [Mariannaea sp. PMI_226]
MFSKLLNLSVAVLVAARAVAADCGEPTKLHCYNGPDDSPQDVTIEDITYAGNYLRAYGWEVDGGRFLTMTAKAAPDCAEWTIFPHGSVIVLAKHINPDKDSSVLYEDVANTIDGGQQRDEVGPALIQCLADGGAAGVYFNSSNPAYNTEEYKKSGYTPEGILIKIVNAKPDEL